MFSYVQEDLTYNLIATETSGHNLLSLEYPQHGADSIVGRHQWRTRDAGGTAPFCQNIYIVDFSTEIFYINSTHGINSQQIIRPPSLISVPHIYKPLMITYFIVLCD